MFMSFYQFQCTLSAKNLSKIDVNGHQFYSVGITRDCNYDFDCCVHIVTPRFALNNRCCNYDCLNMEKNNRLHIWLYHVTLTLAWSKEVTIFNRVRARTVRQHLAKPASKSVHTFGWNFVHKQTSDTQTDTHTDKL